VGKENANFSDNMNSVREHCPVDTFSTRDAAKKPGIAVSTLSRYKSPRNPKQRAPSSSETAASARSTSLSSRKPFSTQNVLLRDAPPGIPLM
jgi:hypothetical protein